MKTTEKLQKLSLYLHSLKPCGSIAVRQSGSFFLLGLRG